MATSTLTAQSKYCNDYFTEQSSLDDTQASIHTDFTYLPIFLTQFLYPLMLSNPFALQLGKAADPDVINNRISKELKDVLSAPLCDLYNASLSQGKVTNICKEASVTLIHKKNVPYNAANYKVRKRAKIRNQYDQEAHPAQDTNTSLFHT